MFEQSFLPAAAKTRRVWTVATSFGLQILGIGAAMLVPLIATERLPVAQLRDALFAPAPPPPAAPKAPDFVRIVDTRIERRPAPRGLVEPTSIPRTIERIVDPPQPERAAADFTNEDGVVGGIPLAGGGSDSVTRSLLRHLADRTPPPAEARAVQTPKAPEPVARIPVTSVLQEGKLIQKVLPKYPPLALQMRLQGTVNLSAIIGADGRVHELQAVSGHPILTPAAIEAVRQWVYQSTILNGKPVEVITTITVNFVLTR